MARNYKVSGAKMSQDWFKHGGPRGPNVMNLPGYRIHTYGHKCAGAMSPRRCGKAITNARTRATKNGRRLARGWF
jgi:hypothetical protein